MEQSNATTVPLGARDARDRCGAGAAARACLSAVARQAEERDVPQDGEERRDQQTAADRPPLREHDQPAEERPDEVEGAADG